MKILVTGHLGYIGAHLTRLLQEGGHEVTGVDCQLFEGCAWEPLPDPSKEIIRDFRNLHSRDLEGHDCLIHLAALSNDPMGALNEALTYSINYEGTIKLAQLAKSAGIPRFLFASSCAIYGRGAKPFLDENDPVAPLTAYAHSKIESEKALFALGDTYFTVASLRNATAYGHSPMLRIDLAPNNLLAAGYALNEIQIHSDGSPWRPYIHCKDIARAFMAFAEAPREAIHRKVVNIGDGNENYQVRDVASMVQNLLPNARIVYSGQTGPDPRNYRVNFDKLRAVLPGFKMEYTLQKGLEDLHQAFITHEFSKTDFSGSQFFRLRTLVEQNRFSRLLTS